MICEKCGTQNTAEGHYCFKCGAQLKASDDTATIVSPPEPALPSLTGKTIDGRYRIDSVLDHGGMGVVYRATRIHIGDVVALKVLHVERHQDPESLERFRREAQAAARLKHPNAVSIYDFGLTGDGLLYLVMELAEGENLARIIKKQGPLPVETCLAIMKQATAAVGEAHRQNIIHRDIKPDNIIVQGTGDSLRVKVLDFGIAKLQDPGNATLTQTGIVVGTPSYMSPEQCMGDPLDGRSDIYSLGVVVYEMLTGKAPFQASTPTAIVVQQVTQSPPSLRSLNPGISPAIERAVMHALEKKRDARPASPEEFNRELEAASASAGREPVPATRVPEIPSSERATIPIPQPAIGTAHQAANSTDPYPRQPAPAYYQHSSGNQQPSAGPVNYGHQYSNPVYTAQPVPQKKSSAMFYAALAIGAILIVAACMAAYLIANSGSDTPGNPKPVPTPSAKPSAISTPSGAPTGYGSQPTPVPSPSLAPSTSEPGNAGAIVPEVTDALYEWAQSIQSRNLDSVMSHYAAVLNPYYFAANASSDRVRGDMATAFSRYSQTVVEVRNLSVQPGADGQSAVAVFDKNFDFTGEKRFAGTVREQMWFKKIGGNWLIIGLKDLSPAK